MRLRSERLRHSTADALSWSCSAAPEAVLTIASPHGRMVWSDSELQYVAVLSPSCSPWPCASTAACTLRSVNETCLIDHTCTALCATGRQSVCFYLCVRWSSCISSSSAARRCTCASTATLHGSPGQLASLCKLTLLWKQCRALLFGSLTGLAQKVAQHLQHLRISLTVFRLPSSWLSILCKISDQGAGDLQQRKRQQGHTALF